jgi:hypothetical protein
LVVSKWRAKSFFFNPSQDSSPQVPLRCCFQVSFAGIVGGRHGRVVPRLLARTAWNPIMEMAGENQRGELILWWCECPHSSDANIHGSILTKKGNELHMLTAAPSLPRHLISGRRRRSRSPHPPLGQRSISGRFSGRSAELPTLPEQKTGANLSVGGKCPASGSTESER